MALPALFSRTSLRPKIKMLAAVMVGAALIAAACSSSDDDTSGAPPPAVGDQEQVADVQQGEDAPANDATPEDDGTEQAEDRDVGAPAGVSAASGFTITRVDQGTKPDIAIAADGTALIAYMLERRGSAGWIRVANADGSNVQELQNGYLYGPLHIETAPDGRVAVAYHDHDNEDGAVAVREGGDWSVSLVANGGHDGWDSSLTFGPNGEIHFLGIGPS